MTLRDEVDQINTQFGEAFAAGDVDRLASFYTEDAVFLEANVPTLVGRASIREKLRGSTLGGRPLVFHSGELLDDGDFVVDIGSITVAGSQVARYVVVYRRQTDGSLKLAVDVPLAG